MRANSTVMLAKLPVLALLALLLMHPNSAAAQSTGGSTLVGTVTDSTGAVVTAAKVTVLNVANAFVSEVQTSSEGSYYVPYLSPGTYRITVQVAGFRQYVRNGVVIRTGETPRIDVQLELGPTTDRVTVTAAASLLATETATAGSVMEGATLVEIPVPQKRPSKFLIYFPGFTTDSGSGYHVEGQRQRAIAYTLDGVSGKVPGTGAALGTNDSLQSVQDAVQEAKVSTTGMSAEIGHSAGGSLALVYRSGTNELHVSAEDRYIGQKMVQRSDLQQFPSTAPESFHEMDYTVAGPVYIPKLYNGKNRTFFLSSFAGHLEHAGNPAINRTVPSQAMMNGDFSFNGIGLPIYNPFTTRQNAAGTWVRDPFPGNQISPSLFDPVVKNFLAQNPFTAPNQPGLMTSAGPVTNLQITEPKTVKRLRWDEKIDHQFSPNHKIFGRYSQAHHRADRAQLYSEFAQNSFGKLLDYNSQPEPIDIENGVVSDTYIFGPARFNEVRVGYHRRVDTLSTLGANQNWAQKLGIPGVSGATFPFFNLSTYRMTAMANTRQVGTETTFQDNFTQILGTHTLKLGYELLRTRYNAVLSSLPGGTYNFAGVGGVSSGGTELPFTPNTGNAFASFLLGAVSSATYNQNFASWLPYWWQHAGYVQDAWKPLRNLTLDLGVRWSYESPMQMKWGQTSEFNPTVTDPLTGKMGAITHPTGQLGKKDLNNFQPRIGLAWNFAPKFVFRSSFGMMTVDVGATTVGMNLEEYQATINVQQVSGNPNSAFYLSQGPGALNYPVASNGSVPYVGTNYSSRNATWYDPNLRAPYIMNWSAGFQYEFHNSWLAEVLYQGTSGVGLLEGWNINQIPLNISTDPAMLNQIYQSQQTYKPYPQFGAINMYSNFGHNTHHNGTVRLEKRYSTGMTLNAFYTYSKTLDACDADGMCTGVDYYNRKLEKGRAGYDIRHSFEGIMTMEVPVGKGRRLLNHGGIVNAIVGGWDLGWVQNFASGLPTSITFANSPNRYLLQGVYRPNALTPMGQVVVPNWSMGPNRFPYQAQNPYLIYKSLAYPAAYTVGTLGRNIYESPGMSWTNVTIHKSWTAKERYKLTLRADLNNLPFKQRQLAQPNSVFDGTQPQLFGTFSAVRGDWTNVGQGQPNMDVGLRFEF
jgi:hypothetical protein